MVVQVQGHTGGQKVVKRRARGTSMQSEAQQRHSRLALTHASSRYGAAKHAPRSLPYHGSSPASARSPPVGMFAIHHGCLADSLLLRPHRSQEGLGLWQASPQPVAQHGGEEGQAEGDAPPPHLHLVCRGGRAQGRSGMVGVELYGEPCEHTGLGTAMAWRVHKRQLTG